MHELTRGQIRADGVALHNGTYTIQNTKSGEWRTFLIRTQPEDARFAPGKRVVALLVGPDNERSYEGFAFLDHTAITVWSRKRGVERRSAYDVYADMLESLLLDASTGEWAQRGYVILCEGRCIVCNRKLTTPDSVRSGIGPICAGGRGQDEPDEEELENTLGVEIEHEQEQRAFLSGM